MTPGGPTTTGTDSRSLAATLEPVLAEVCEGKLHNINWFKADWQRGGAATGFSSFALNGDTEQPVVVKLPVVPRELRWTRRLQLPETAPGVAPRVFASGSELGGYDFAWIVIERFQHGPLGLHWHDDHVKRIAGAVADFSLAANRFPVDEPPRREDWPDLVAGAIENVRINDVADSARWLNALKQLRRQLPDWVEHWRHRQTEWLHGDIHLANAMSRDGLDHGSVSLIDLAEVHAGHWVEDAVYLERQLWARPERLAGEGPVKAIARARRKAGLTVGSNDLQLAMIRRGLLAATAPRFLRSEGHPKHLAACLDWLETAIASVESAA